MKFDLRAPFVFGVTLRPGRKKVLKLSRVSSFSAIPEDAGPAAEGTPLVTIRFSGRNDERDLSPSA